MDACHCMLVHLCRVFNTKSDTAVKLTLGDGDVSNVDISVAKHILA